MIASLTLVESLFIFAVIFGLPSLCVSVEQRSLWPVPICISLGILVLANFKIYDMIKKSRRRRSAGRFFRDAGRYRNL